jgi:hypothetical protein
MMLRSTCRFVALAATMLFGAAGPALGQRMHFLGIAGSSGEKVFRTEVSAAAKTIDAAWPLASSRIVGGPFGGGATYSAIRRSIRQAADSMNLEHDVLFLLISTHGESDGQGVELSGGGLMTAGMLRAALDEAGVRNRIVLISACFSGQFVGPLSGQNTAVITAANVTGLSSGCRSGCTYTDFGEAFFNRGMRRSGRNLRQAFDLARVIVTTSERRDRIKLSQPQMNIGTGIAKTLAALR